MRADARSAFRPVTSSVEKNLEEARALLRAGDRARAEELLRRVLRRDPSQPDASYALGRLALEAGRNEEAVPLIEQAIAGDASVSRYRADLAVALQNLGRHQEAATEARRALALE